MSNNDSQRITRSFSATFSGVFADSTLRNRTSIKLNANGLTSTYVKLEVVRHHATVKHKGAIQRRWGSRCTYREDAINCHRRVGVHNNVVARKMLPE